MCDCVGVRGAGCLEDVHKLVSKGGSTRRGVGRAEGGATVQRCLGRCLCGCSCMGEGSGRAADTLATPATSQTKPRAAAQQKKQQQPKTLQQEATFGDAFSLVTLQENSWQII